MWFVNLQTGVNHECDERTFNRFYKNDADYQVIPDIDTTIEDAEIIEDKPKTKKQLIAEAKELGVKGADRMSIEDLEKAVR